MKVLLTATVQSHICQFHKPLVEVLHKNGYEVHVAARNNLAEKNGLKLDFADRTFDVPFSRSPKSIDNLKAYKKLKKIIDEEQYGVIHCNTPMGGVVTRLAARKSRAKGTKVYYTAHGFHFYKGAPKKNWLIFYPIEKLLSRLTDKVITINDEDYQLAAEKFHCKVEHIHGVGVDENRYFPIDSTVRQRCREKMGFSMEQKVILCVGELLPNKNQKMAIHMMRQIVDKYPDARLLLAGNGPNQQALEKEINDIGLQENVCMLGYVTNLQDYYHISDILVSCSKREGLPLNVVEAMLSGVCVVASKNRGHIELVEDGKNGYLVDYGDEDAMAKKVLLLLDNPEKLESIRVNGIAFAQRYISSAVKEELDRIYED